MLTYASFSISFWLRILLFFYIFAASASKNVHEKIFEFSCIAWIFLIFGAPVKTEQGNHQNQDRYTDSDSHDYAHLSFVFYIGLTSVNRLCVFVVNHWTVATSAGASVPITVSMRVEGVTVRTDSVLCLCVFIGTLIPGALHKSEIVTRRVDVLNLEGAGWLSDVVVGGAVLWSCHNYEGQK